MADNFLGYYMPQSEAPGDRYHYECIACDSEAVVFEAARECA